MPKALMHLKAVAQRRRSEISMLNAAEEVISALDARRRKTHISAEVIYALDAQNADALSIRKKRYSNPWTLTLLVMVV